MSHTRETGETERLLSQTKNPNYGSSTQEEIYVAAENENINQAAKFNDDALPHFSRKKSSKNIEEAIQADYREGRFKKLFNFFRRHKNEFAELSEFYEKHILPSLSASAIGLGLVYSAWEINKQVRIQYADSWVAILTGGLVAQFMALLVALGNRNDLEELKHLREDIANTMEGLNGWVFLLKLAESMYLIGLTHFGKDTPQELISNWKFGLLVGGVGIPAVAAIFINALHVHKPELFTKYPKLKGLYISLNTGMFGGIINEAIVNIFQIEKLSYRARFGAFVGSAILGPVVGGIQTKYPHQSHAIITTVGGINLLILFGMMIKEILENNQQNNELHNPNDDPSPILVWTLAGLYLTMIAYPILHSLGEKGLGLITNYYKKKNDLWLSDVNGSINNDDKNSELMTWENMQDFYLKSDHVEDNAIEKDEDNIILDESKIILAEEQEAARRYALQERVKPQIKRADDIILQAEKFIKAADAQIIKAEANIARAKEIQAKFGLFQNPKQEVAVASNSLKIFNK